MVTPPMNLVLSKIVLQLRAGPGSRWRVNCELRSVQKHSSSMRPVLLLESGRHYGIRKANVKRKMLLCKKTKKSI